ncbi:MAG: biotin--[acetyl-CoA-carboxylase] ligase [Coriobacteriia bacterium]|nr:biotin--[acetyl-CoA-carboxylase] ligase [Coriobacteriia bacterium]
MTTRDRVLAALREAGAEGLSGEKLARELGISRVAVAKHVAGLRASGYSIDALLGSGYQLTAVPDLPLPAEVTILLKDPFWTALTGGGETASTNDDARVLTRTGAAEGTVALASRQTDGQGRLGRTWDSPLGGAYFSAVLRPATVPSAVASLALAVALGVARGLASMGFSPQLKWPNDVFLASGKVCGILLHMTAEADRVAWVVAGVGINVHRPSSGSIAREGAAWLGDVDPAVRIPETIAAVLDGIASVYAAWVTHGFSALRAEYESLLLLTGHNVTVRDLSGVVIADGVALGVDDDGRLLVRQADGWVVPVAAGDVTLR